MRRWSLVAVVFLTALGALVGCGAPGDRSLPPPKPTSSTTPEPATTKPNDVEVVLAPVEGSTTTAAPITVGASTVRGVVTGPEGPLPDAVVRIERLVGDAVQRTDVRSGPDGRYELARLPGGRYRIRAFQPPTLTSERPEIFYLVDGEERDVGLPTVPFVGLAVRASTTPGAPTVGNGVNLAVRVAQREVDADGIGRETPLGNVPVRVSANGWTSLDDDSRAVTDDEGVAVFSYRCDQVTQVSATAVVGEAQEAFPLDVPPCAPRPTTTTTSSTTSAPRSTTSTTSA